MERKGSIVCPSFNFLMQYAYREGGGDGGEGGMGGRGASNIKIEQQTTDAKFWILIDQ